ncbi:MAG: hypothetical protein O7D29_06540 [Gemmatimonadetes bacterium]|nr:hypothetical protein [Gemmatimonadota bacterium]
MIREGLGYTPSGYDALRPSKRWDDCFVISWDLTDSTRKVQQSRTGYRGYWSAQSSLMIRVIPNLPFPPDVTLPTGDGFLLVFDLGRAGGEGYVTKEARRDMVIPILRKILEYQEFLQGWPKTRVGPASNPYLCGRFGVASGEIEVYTPLKRAGGTWMMPVGEPFFRTKRLQAAAPTGGALVEECLIPDDAEPVINIRGEDHPFTWLQRTKEEVSLKGFELPVEVWRFAPKPSTREIQEALYRGDL